MKTQRSQKKKKSGEGGGKKDGHNSQAFWGRPETMNLGTDKPHLPSVRLSSSHTDPKDGVSASQWLLKLQPEKPLCKAKKDRTL